MSILSIRLCEDCKRRLHKNPANSGDYDEEGRLLSFCPVCGNGYPALGTGIFVVNITISRRKLKNLSAKTAMKYSLPFKEVNNLAKPLKGFELDRAFEKFRNEISEKYQIELPPEIFSGI